jgi:hypothetical protein
VDQMNKAFPIVSTPILLDLSSRQAFAHLDPGTGSLIALGLIAGGLVATKLYLHRVKKLFKRK